MLGASLEVAGQVRAGEIWRGGTLRSGAAVEIMTGAPVPEGADAVVMIEHVTRNGSAISRQAGHGLGAGDNLVRRGSEAQCGHEVLRAGTRIGPAEIALAATCGIAKLDVFRQPRVAIVATGDELVGLDEQLEPQQIRNSNGYAIAAMGDGIWRRC